MRNPDLRIPASLHQHPDTPFFSFQTIEINEGMQTRFQLIPEKSSKRDCRVPSYKVVFVPTSGSSGLRTQFDFQLGLLALFAGNVQITSPRR